MGEGRGALEVGGGAHIYLSAWVVFSAWKTNSIGCSLFSLGESRNHETTRVSPILIAHLGEGGNAHERVYARDSKRDVFR